MTLLLFALVGFLFATVGRADEFFLKDHLGKETGPFAAQQGAKIQAGAQEFVVSRVVPVNAEGAILRRLFRVEQTYAGCVYRVSATNAAPEESSVSSQAIMDVLTQVGGVQWPRGSSVVHNRSIGALIVANTAENMDRIQRALVDLNVLPKQIEIQMLYLQFDATNVVQLVPDNINAHSLLRLWTNGCGRLLSAPRVVTRSGSEASIRGVSEMIYPTSYVAPGCVGQTNAMAPDPNGLTVGTDFQTREVGTILTVLPEVSPAGDRVNLTITPSYNEPITVWRDYGYDLPEIAGKARHITNEQPFFQTCTLNTQVAMADGATVLVGGGTPTRDGKGLVYSFLTVQVVGDDGEPLRKHGVARDAAGY